MQTTLSQTFGKGVQGRVTSPHIRMVEPQPHHLQVEVQPLKSKLE